MDIDKKPKVLLIDDEESICQDIERVLIKEGYNVEYRLSGEKGIEYLEQQPETDIVVLDVMIGSGLNGVECLKMMKDRFRHLQIVMLTGEKGLNIGIECMRNGAYDYLIKPFNKRMLLEKVWGAIEKKRQLELTDEEYKKTKEKVVRDGLTELYNRRYLDDYMLERINIGHESENSMCLLMIDIDHFKQFNDQYGHQTGDEVLKHISQLMRNAVRGSDFVSRYGGEEFVVVLNDISVENAGRVAEKIRTSIQANPLRIVDGAETKSLGVTVSIGVSVLIKGEDCAALIKRSDHALYLAKEAGRNKVVTDTGQEKHA